MVSHSVNTIFFEGYIGIVKNISTFSSTINSKLIIDFFFEVGNDTVLSLVIAVNSGIYSQPC